MARVVDTMPRKRASKYDKFLDGCIWELTANDFGDLEPRRFQQGLIITARRRGMRTRSRMLGDRLLFQAYRKADDV